MERVEVGYDRKGLIRNRNRISKRQFRFLSTGTGIPKSNSKSGKTGTGFFKVQSGSGLTGLRLKTGIPAGIFLLLQFHLRL